MSTGLMVALVCAVLALAYGFWSRGWIMAQPAGNPRMQPDLSQDASAFQSWIRAVHHYPFITVIEKRDQPVKGLIAPRHGTEWQPFLEKDLPR